MVSRCDVCRVDHGCCGRSVRKGYVILKRGEEKKSNVNTHNTTFLRYMTMYDYFIVAFPSQVAMALLNISRQGTLLPSLAHSRNAPESLRWREYVSSGGGARRSLTMTGIKLRTRSVMVWSLKS
jgi:hypothetical protein